MYLVDTSVWIDYLRDKDNLPVQYFAKILEDKIPLGITSHIYQEIVQGAISKKDFEMLSEYLITQHFFHPKDQIETYQAAAKIYFDCRCKGITIRSTIDCLIAQIAIEHNLILLHNDQDFLRINKVKPALRLAHCH